MHQRALAARRLLSTTPRQHHRPALRQPGQLHRVTTADVAGSLRQPGTCLRPGGAALPPQGVSGVAREAPHSLPRLWTPPGGNLLRLCPRSVHTQPARVDLLRAAPQARDQRSRPCPLAYAWFARLGVPPVSPTKTRTSTQAHERTGKHHPGRQTTIKTFVPQHIYFHKKIHFIFT